MLPHHPPLHLAAASVTTLNPMGATELAMRTVLLVDHWYGDSAGPTTREAVAYLVQHLAITHPHALRLLATAMDTLGLRYDPHARHVSIDQPGSEDALSAFLCDTGASTLARRQRLATKAIELGYV